MGMIPLSGVSQTGGGRKSGTSSTGSGPIMSQESTMADPIGPTSNDRGSTRQVSATSTSVISSSTSFLGKPVCNRTAYFQYGVSDACIRSSSNPYWDAVDMGEYLPQPQIPMTAASVVISFPGTTLPSTSYPAPGTYLAIGMAAQSQEGTGGPKQDYADFAMVYLTSSGQPMIIGEVWTLPDGYCEAAPYVCSDATLDFASGWTCSCYTSTSFVKMITLTMQWNYCISPCNTTLDWQAIVDGVQYTLFSYTPTNTAQRFFHVGQYKDNECIKYGLTPPCPIEWFQFGAMFNTIPNSGWNAYIGSAKYFDYNNHMWRLVQQSYTTISPSSPGLPFFDWAYEIGGDGSVSTGIMSATNALDGCSNSGNFPGTSSPLKRDQLVIHPATLVKGQVWGASCPADIYPPTSSFTSGPAAGSWQNNAFALSATDQDTGKISAAPGGLAQCFYSVESLIGSSWAVTHPTSVRTCSSTMTVTVGNSLDCQSTGANTCRVNVWSEDYAGNFGPAALMFPSDGDFYTEGQIAYLWTCQVNGAGCGTGLGSQYIIGSGSANGFWQSSGGSYIVMMEYPATISSNTWNIAQMGSSDSPPEIFAYVQSSDQPYSVSFEFLTDANDGYVSDVLPQGAATDTGLYIGDTNWHLFQYAVGPYGDSFTSFGSPNWSNINQIDICINYLQGFTSGNAYVDGLVFLNPGLTKTTQSFNIGDFGVSSNPTSITTLAGSAAGSTITVTGLGLTGTINLSASPSQSGLLCTLTPNSVTFSSTTSSATSALSCNGSAGSYSVTVTGTGSNLSHSTTVDYTVQDFTITASPTSVNLNAGSAGASTVTVTAVDGFVGVASLATNSTSCTVSPTSVTGSGSATLSCAFASTGTKHVSVTGTSGSLSHTVTVTFVVQDFTITASPTSVNVNVNAAGTSTITISAVNGFAGVVSLATNTTASCTVSPASFTGSGSATLSCTFTSTGTKHVFVTGASGSLSHSVMVTFVVQDFAIAASPTSVTVNANAPGTSTVTVAAVNGFTGFVSLMTNSTSCTVSPTSVTGSGSATLSCTFSSALTIHVGVTGTSGSLSHPVAVTYVVRDFSISASSPATVNEGSSTTSTIAVTYMNGFTGTVALTDSVPSGLNCGSISPSSVTASGSATVSCSATVAGSYVLTITGTSGSLTHSTSATFAFAGFTVTATSPSGNVGSSITSTITVLAVNGFSGTVTLTDTLPSGLTCGAISPSSLTGFGSATLSCSSTSTTSYSVTIKGTSGSLAHSATTVFAFTDFSIALSPSSVTISAGTSSQILVTLASLNGFSGTINLSQSVTPAATDAPTVPSSGTAYLASGQSFSYYLVIATVTTTPQQTYSVTVVGVSGSLSHSTPVTASITAPPPPPSYVFPGTFTQSGGISGAQVTALTGLPVSVTITLSSATSQTAHLSVEIRSDIVFYPDTTAAWLNQTVTVGPGTVGRAGSFTPTIVTSGCIGCVRQFFIRVWWGGQLIYDPTDANSRESVQTTGSDYSIASNTSIVCVSSGSSDSSTRITVASRSGFSGSVSLSSAVSPVLTGGPTGSLNPTSISVGSGGSGTSTLTISTTSSTPNAYYTITVTGTSGSLIRSVSITVYVSCGGGGGGGSLAYGTLITMYDGSRVAVQNLKVGDTMLGYDPATGEYSVSVVKAIKVVEANNMLVINTETGTPLRVDASSTEILWTKLDNGTTLWLPVTQLTPGDSLFTQDGWVKVTSIQSAPAGRHVLYDITATVPYFADGYLDPPLPS